MSKLNLKISLAIILWLIMFVMNVSAQNDLPNPSPFMISFPEGSLVVGMDNSTQAVGSTFNLKAYGLLNLLLQHEIKLHWIINSNKGWNGIDFTATAVRETPTVLANATYSFRAGPFIIDSLYADTARSIINAYGNNVCTYRLTQSVTVDRRYQLVHKPNIAVLSNGGNQNIHLAYLQEAGFLNPVVNMNITPGYTDTYITPADTQMVIIDNDTTYNITPADTQYTYIPADTTYYTTYEAPWVTVIPASEVLDWGGCYTFASEPHWEASNDTAHTHPVKRFLLNGSNFLAQCEGVQTYELDDTIQTTAGITKANASFTYNYFNAAMPFAQIQGTLWSTGGSLRNWQLASGSSYRSTYYRVVGDANGIYDVASGAKILPNNYVGGNAFYLGGHDYGNGPQIDRRNGRRLYLNSIFIPANPLGVCNQLFALPIELLNFDAYLKGDDVEIVWTTATETNNQHFTIDRTQDGENFTFVARVEGSGHSTTALHYKTTDRDPLPGVSYYRLTQTDFDGSTWSSDLVPVRIKLKEDIFHIYPNPATSKNIIVSFNSWENDELILAIENVMGQVIYSEKIFAKSGDFYRKEVSLNKELSGGMYLVSLRSENRSQIQKLIVK